MQISGEIWLGIAGIGYTAGTLILGKMLERGKKEQKFETVVVEVGNLRSDFQKINDSLIGCQKASSENRGILRTKTQNVDDELARLRAETVGHSSDRNIHTDQEWRKNTTDRLEAIATSIGVRIGVLETNVVGQIEALRTQIKNGSNGKGGQ
jgi:hypothetical protein